MFVPLEMTIQLRDGRIVKFEFNKEDIQVEAVSGILTEKEKAQLCFKAGVFVGGGNKILADFD